MSESATFDTGISASWRTNTRTINATDVVELQTLEAQPTIATYTALATSIATTNSADHLIFIQADGTLYTRIHRIYVEQVVGATTATLAQLQILRTSTAGSGGGAITANPMDAGDAAYGGTIQTLPTVKGTEGVPLVYKRLQLLTTAQVAAKVDNPSAWEWLAQDGMKPITIGASSTEGVCLKIVTGIATSTLDISITFTTDTNLDD